MAIATSYSENPDGSPSDSTLRVATSAQDKSFQRPNSLRKLSVNQGRRSSCRSIAPAPSPTCDACPRCSDVCGDENCMACREKTLTSLRGNRQNCSNEPSYTMCEVRRHANAHSAWLVVGDNIYDATDYMSMHPGGAHSILKKCGGVCDCTADLNFHSKNGKKVWEKYKIGKLRPCGHQQEDKTWWMFWK